jgi:hypothetical protein
MLRKNYYAAKIMRKEGRGKKRGDAGLDGEPLGWEGKQICIRGVC